jgi:putative ABC transport system permease protein
MMLQLRNIVKNYEAGNTQVEALRGVDIEFRRSEFVAVLGPSGCGKTTLLNIIGGLDRYTNGDLIVDGVSTKKYRDADWDIYRNKEIGFVFQTYNLIAHQTVLSNVELALTLSGVSKGERKRRAAAALERVGLGDQLKKKPNQLSGGQMQRVAIARSLVNDPEILLADEPTGALDTENSVQIMEILKEIAKDRLVVMVTHNPDLADRYATRIIRLLDGRVTDDTNPYTGHAVHTSERTRGAEHSPKKNEKLKERRNRKKPLTILTALSLSLNNLLTKKARTLLTGFAGSIGIIGIALILSLSSGMQAYIAGIERDTVASYPIIIESSSVELGAMLGMAADMRESAVDHDLDKIYSKDVMGGMLEGMTQGMTANDLASFKEYLDTVENIDQYTNDIQYTYDTPLIIYKSDTAGGAVKLNPSTLMEGVMPAGSSNMAAASPFGSDPSNAWKRLMDDEEVLNAQFDIIEGRLPAAWDEVVIIADEHNEITDFMLYSLGLKDQSELRQMMRAAQSGEELEIEPASYTYDELMGLTFKLLLPTDMYEQRGTGWVDKSEDADFMKQAVDGAPSLRVVGILRETPDAAMGGMNGAVGYTAELMDHVASSVRQSDIARAQMDNPELDVFTGKPFANSASPSMPDLSQLTDEQRAQLAALSPEQIAGFMGGAATASSATYEDNISKLGVSDAAHPSGIRIYPRDFDGKGELANMIRDYNFEMTAAGQDEKVIQYTDYTDILMSSVDTVIGGISTVLIAFVSISLVVSSIMIGIITYISVLERTKEIGVLRSIGASKGDISRVFNAETLIVGFLAGALGIAVTFLLCIPANAIVERLTGITNAAQLPIIGAVSLVLISMALTFISGLIPARIAAKKDPVVALRTE